MKESGFPWPHKAFMLHFITQLTWNGTLRLGNQIARVSCAVSSLLFHPSVSFNLLLPSVPFSRLFLPGATTCNPFGDRRSFQTAHPSPSILSHPPPSSLLEPAFTAFLQLHPIDSIADRVRWSVKGVTQWTRTFYCSVYQARLSLYQL